MHHLSPCTDEAPLLTLNLEGPGSNIMQWMEMWICCLMGKILNWVEERLFKDVSVFL